MSRSYRKNPYNKGKKGSWKWDRTYSNRLYRRFVKRMMDHEKYDEIHDNNKMFWDRWCWCPEYKFYFGAFKNPTLGYGVWKLWYEIRQGRDHDEVIEEIIGEKKQDYKRLLRK